MPTGVYEMRGHWTDGPYHVIIFAFLSPVPVLMPAVFTGHHVDEVVQVDPAACGRIRR